jgi:hypothetical protein
MGVKEVDDLLPDKTYIFFSHSYKGQKAGMPRLKEILDKKIRLLDYELLTDENYRRLVAFGRFAGYAGMIDGMHGLGKRLLSQGYGTPFLVGYVSNSRISEWRTITQQSTMQDWIYSNLGSKSRRMVYQKRSIHWFSLLSVYFYWNNQKAMEMSVKELNTCSIAFL